MSLLWCSDPGEEMLWPCATALSNTGPQRGWNQVAVASAARQSTSLVFLLLSLASSPAAPSAYALAWCWSGFGVCKPSELAALFASVWLPSFQLFLCDELVSCVMVKASGDSEPGEFKGRRGSWKTQENKPRRAELGSGEAGWFCPLGRCGRHPHTVASRLLFACCPLPLPTAVKQPRVQMHTCNL